MHMMYALQTLVEYVWVGTSGALRSKTKVLDSRPLDVSQVPVIVVEAEQSYGGQAWVENNAEVFLRPRKLFRDPFRGGDHLLVLCDHYDSPQVRCAAAGDGRGCSCRGAAQPGFVLRPRPGC